MMVSAYIPCYNNAATLRAAVESIMAQTVPVDELFVVDDGSTDASPAIVQALGVRLLRHECNRGRGAVRAAAMNAAAHDLVLGCDATNVLASDFVKKALPWFEDPKVAAVFGGIVAGSDETSVARWRARHLFKVDMPKSVDRHALLATGGVMLRKSPVLNVGSFNPQLRHSEDAELGTRLLAGNYDVVFDPKLNVIANAGNTLGQVLERYWRWHAGPEERVTWQGYAKQIVYSVKVMARQDIEASDWPAVPISLLSPHYQFWKSWQRNVRKRSAA